MCRNHHPEKMCRNHHPEKNRFDWKSQGQIFQECQGQIPRSNPKVKWENKNGKSEKTGKTGFNRKKWEKWEMEKWESVTKMKKPKTLKEILIL